MALSYLLSTETPDNYRPVAEQHMVSITWQVVSRVWARRLGQGRAWAARLLERGRTRRLRRLLPTDTVQMTLFLTAMAYSRFETT